MKLILCLESYLDFNQTHLQLVSHIVNTLAKAHQPVPIYIWYDLLARSNFSTRYALFLKNKFTKNGRVYKNSFGIGLPRLVIRANPATQQQLGPEAE